ncbi:MAG: iron-sulfur cluster assembly scaffold protein [Campylobacterota bacterium]|nr:iron-sulfur cluster assembly scaffold protein [Campylobacterota bacterium]
MKNTENIEEQQNRISAEVLEHMMNPKNYGKLEDADGIGMGADKKTGEFAMVYIKVDDDILSDISFGCNACQDTVIAGSLFTEMVKGDTLENSIKALKLMGEKILEAPKKNQACTGMILTAMRAALINRENKIKNIDEDMFTIDIKESCEGINLA